MREREINKVRRLVAERETREKRTRLVLTVD